MSFGVSQDELDLALASLEKEGARHYDVRCPRCRQVNHLSLEQVRRSARRPSKAPDGSSESGPA
jgi:hypothetical protein